MKPSSNSITGERERERERERLSERLSGAIFGNRGHHQPSSSRRTVFLPCIAAFRSPRAFALVISLGLVALIMIVTINLTRDGIEHMREFAEIEQTTEAYYAAESALDAGLLANKEKDAGYEARVECDKTGKCVDQDGKPAEEGWGIDYTDPVTGNGAYGTWTVQGRTRCLWNDDRTDDPSICDSTKEDIYYIPRPGTGDAGSKCDPLGEYPDADDPCNWAKIGVGEKVAIPLYITNSDESVTSPWDTSQYGLQGIKLRVRTPCTATTGAYNRFPCEDVYGNSARYVLDQEDDKNIYDNEGDTLLSWQISGNCDVDVDGNGDFNGAGDDKEGCTLLPVDEFDHNEWLRSEKPNNSEIYEKLINDAGGNYSAHPYEVLTSKLSNIWGSDENSQGKDMNGVYGYIADFITNVEQCGTDCNDDPIPAIADWRNRHINKPVLKLNLVHSLKDENGGAIPYLEYQVVLDVDTAIPADMYQTIIGEGYSGNFKQSVEIKKGLKTGVIDFVIQN